MSSDPFQDGHRRAERQAEAERSKQEIVQRDARVVASAAKRAAAARPEKPHPWPKRFFEP